MTDKEIGQAIADVLNLFVDEGHIFTHRGIKSLEGLGAMVRELTNTPTHTLQLTGVTYYDCNGNCSFILRIYWDDELVHNSGKEQGSYDLCLQYAKKWLNDNGCIDCPKNEPLWKYCEENDIKYIDSSWEAQTYKRFKMELSR